MENDQRRNSNKDLETLEDSYIEHLLDSTLNKAENVHYLEGANPESAEVVLNETILNTAKKLEQVYTEIDTNNRINELQQDLKNPTPDTQTTPIHNTSEQTSSNTKPEEDSNNEYQYRIPRIKSGFLKRIAMILPFVGFLSHTQQKDTNYKENNFPTNQTEIYSKLLDNVKFESNLTEEQIAKRKDFIKSYLADSLDIEDNSIKNIEKKYQIEIKIALKKIINAEKQLNSFVSNNLQDPKRELEVLKEIVEKKRDDFKNLLIKKEKEEELSNKYLKNRDSLKLEKILDIYKNYDQQKKWLRENIQSKEYLDRLTIELGGNEKEARIEQNNRLQRLENDYIFNTTEEIHKKHPGAFAFFDGDTTHFPYDNYIDLDINKTIGTHEFEHEITIGNSRISKYAKDLYKKAFNAKKTTDKIVADGRTEKAYYGEATELDARKKQLEKELESLLIKRYGEKFTKEHYKIILKLIKENEFNFGTDSRKFIELIKPEYIEKIMNTIALEDNKDKVQEDLS